MHGAGFTGSGEDHLASIVTVEGDSRGTRARADGQHRDRPGHEHDLLADRRRRARHGRRRHRRSCSPTRRSCRTADRRSRRAPAWSSASWSRPPAATLQQTLADGGYLTPMTATSRAACRAYVESTARCAPRRSTSPPKARAGTTSGTRGMPTGPTPGPPTSPKSPSTSRPSRSASTTSSPCRRSAASSTRCWRPGRSKAASRRRSAGRSTRTSSGAKAGWPTRR